MSKKLILFLMLVVFGSTNLLKAEEVLIGDPAGGTDTYLPVNSQYKYMLTQQIYTAEEIGTAGTINSFTMWLKNSSSYSRNVRIYMKNVSMDAFEILGGWAQMSEADFVATGTIGSGVSKPVSPEAVTFTLSTPFEYDGESNLVICFADVTGSAEYGVAGVIFQDEKCRTLYCTSSGAIDITNIPTGMSKMCRNVVSLDITVPFSVSSKDFGPRPNNAWMEPATFEVLGDGYTVTAMNIDNDYFTFDGPAVPFTTPATFAVTTGNAATGNVPGHVAFIYEGSRGNERVDINATAYDPTEGDVVEKAKIVEAGFSTYTDQPSEIYHNYNLPGEDSNNPDAVYRLNFYNLPKDVLLKANIVGGDRGEGKVALYKEEADGTCHPMRNNAYEYAGMLGGKTLDGNGMYVEKGGIYYLVAQAADGFTVNINALEAPAPEKPVVTYPVNNSSISPVNVTAKWNIGEFTTKISVLLKSEYDDDWATIKDWTSCITETGTLDEMQLSNLVEATKYYLRVDAKNAAGEVESDVVTFYTKASAPTNLSVNKNKIFEGDAVRFSWNYTRSSEVTGYNIYCDGDQLNPSAITTKYFDYTFGPGTYKINPGHKITVTAVFSNGTESAASAPVTVKVSGYAVHYGGTVYADAAGTTPLAGATVTFAGKDEFNNNVSFTTTSDANGAYAFVSGLTDNRLKAGTSYTRTATLPGLYEKKLSNITVAYNQVKVDADFKADMNVTAPANLTDTEIFVGDKANLTWECNTASPLLSGYKVYVYSNEVLMWKDSITGNVKEYEIDDLGYNMDGYTVKVTAVYRDGDFESAPDEALVKVAGYAEKVTATVTDQDGLTVLQGVTVTLEGKDPFGNSVTYNGTTDATGLCEFKESDGSASKIKEGFYTWTAEHADFETRSDDIFINYMYDDNISVVMHEKYYAPSKVTADTIDDNKVVRVEWDMRSLRSFNIYVRQIAGEGIEPGAPVVESLAEGYNAVSSTWYDNAWETRVRGVYQYGVQANYEDNQNPTRGTSDTTWSNTLGKDMYMESFTFKASTEDEESVEGAYVTMTNVSEPEAGIAYKFYMDDTGVHQIVDFRRGDYNIEVKPADDDHDHDAFTEVKNLWDASEYSVELEETKFEVKNVYVSHTGYARWDKPTVKDRGFNGYYLYVDDEFVKETADTCYQIDCTELAIDSHKFTVGVVQNTTENKTDVMFDYSGCSAYEPISDPNYYSPKYKRECNNVLVTWGNDDEFKEGFENGSIPTGWTTIDADGDGHNWTPASVLMAGYLIPFHSGADCITSESYSSTVGVLTPDNYLVTPKVAIANGSTFSFWACAQDPDYASEHYGVAISTTTATAGAFTTIAEWTMTAKEAAGAGAYMSKNGKGTREGSWYQKTVDLSSYAGQEVYIAIRHFNCSDMFYLNVDDAELTVGEKWEKEETLLPNSWALYLDGKLEKCVSKNIRHYEMTIPGSEDHTFKVVSIDDEYNMSCGDYVTFTVGVTTKPENLAATEENNGIKLTWEGNSSEYIVYKGFTTNNMILLGTVKDGTTEFVDEVVMSGCLYGVSGLSDCGESEMATVEFGALEDPHYTPEDQYFSATMNVIGYVAIDNVEPLLNSNLEIGAFITDIYGVRHCCGSARSIYAPSENHNIFQFKVYGDTENDVITFELYDHSTGEVLDYLISKSTLNFKANGSAGTIENPFIFKFFSTVTHEMRLKGIGNWVSTYIELSGEEGLGIIEDGLGENAVEIKVDNKFTTYVEGYGWWGTLETADSRNMFIIRMSNEADVTFTGMVADPADHPITIHRNWNRIGYISKKAMDVNTALGTLNPAVGDQIKCKEIYADYYEGYGWVGSLMTMEPGKGYMYYSNSDEPDTLVYPVAAPSRVENAAGNATAADSHWTVESSRFAMNMSVTAAVTVDGSLVENGDIEVGAFCNGEVRGSARPVYVEPLDRYVIFLTVFGNEGDNISFRLFNPEDGSEYTAVEHLVYSDDAIKGGIKDPFMLNFGDDNISVFPNPTKGNVVISADGMKNISVVNTLGQTVYRQAANAGEMTIDMSQFGAGMYLISIETENGTTVKRVTVTR